MAERPIFVSTRDSDELVKEIFFQIHWHSGFARVQKEKNIEELHEAAALTPRQPQRGAFRISWVATIISPVWLNRFGVVFCQDRPSDDSCQSD